MNLDKTKPYGTIAGDVFIPEGCDRPAAYEQDGKLFDSHGRVLLSGTPAAKPKSNPTAAAIPASSDDDVDVEDVGAPTMSVAELLRQADLMHWRTFKAAASKVLGPECPATKATIIEALKLVQGEFDARANRKAKERAAAPTATAPAKAAIEGGVDLGAWARGHKEYLWGEVRKAMMSKYGRKVSERDDAVEFLVAEGVVSSAEARQDVIRGA